MTESSPEALSWREAGASDLDLLADLNVQLIQDEGHSNPMTRDMLKSRMRAWLAAEYSAVIFDHAGGAVGYALYRQDQEGVYLRQFFVARGERRKGFGRNAIALLRTEVCANEPVMTLEVLSDNARAIAFWRSVDFVPYAIRMRAGSAADQARESKRDG